MCQFIITAVIFFGGIVMYIINQFMFKTFKMNNISKILLFLGAFIPCAGLVIQLFYTFWASSHYQTWGFYDPDLVQVRDSNLNRWLFDDVKWDEYDEQKQRKKEREQREAELRAASEEQKRRAKLVEGLKIEESKNSKKSKNED
jgi:branched-subunit amino acid transport protein AzlD